MVQLTAVADPGWAFSGWSGDLSGSDNLANITIDGDKTVTATFVESGYALYAEDFESYAAGADPADWLDTKANNSMVPDDSLFKVFDVGGQNAFGTTSTLSNIHSHYVGAGSAGWTGYRYSGRMMISDPNGGIGVTLLSDYTIRRLLSTARCRLSSRASNAS